MKKLLILIALFGVCSCKKKDPTPTSTGTGGNYQHLYTNYYLTNSSGTGEKDTIHFISGQVSQLTVNSILGDFGAQYPYTVVDSFVTIPPKYDVSHTKHIGSYNSGMPNVIRGNYLHLSISVMNQSGWGLWSRMDLIYKRY